MCAICMEKHDRKNCKAIDKKCINCVNFAKNLGSNNCDIGHSANDRKCPYLMRVISNNPA